MERVTDPADPRRCKGAAPDGQCRNQAEEGSDYCRVHGGAAAANRLMEERKNGFLLAKANDRARLSQISEEMEPVKQLREAIALNHMLIERRFNLIRDDNDLINHSGHINTMLLTMERLTTSAHRLEQNLGALLGRQAIINLGKKLVEILIEELEDVEDYEIIIDRITSKLFGTIEQANNREETKIEAHIALPSPDDEEEEYPA